MSSAALASPWLRGGLMALVGGILTLGLVAGGARLEAPTVGLGLAAVALLYALRRLYALAAALAGPESAAGLGADFRSHAELRDEKRRLLRALKELDFDHGMGKLSQADYEAVAAIYKMRAIEVMRALEGTSELHPALQALLDARSGKVAVAAGAGEASPPVGASAVAMGDVTSRTCPKCNGTNDGDARFCKHCGAGLSA